MLPVVRPFRESGGGGRLVFSFFFSFMFSSPCYLSLQSSFEAVVFVFRFLLFSFFASAGSGAATAPAFLHPSLIAKVGFRARRPIL